MNLQLSTNYFRTMASQSTQQPHTTCYQTPYYSPQSYFSRYRFKLPTFSVRSSARQLERSSPSHASRLPADIVLLICSYLSVRDVLVLRRVNKYYNTITSHCNVWYEFLARLRIFYPILPATSRNLFGSIAPGTYEKLVTRGIYLEANWGSSVAPEADVFLSETYHIPIQLSFLPGGKYLFMVMKNNGGGSEKFALVLFDVEAQMTLLKVGVQMELGHLKTRFAMVKGEPHIVVACTVHHIENNRLWTRVQVLGVPLSTVEKLSDTVENREQHEAQAANISQPFTLLHDATVEGKVTDLDIVDTEGSLLLAIVIIPLSIIFTYIGNETQHSSLLLERIPEQGYIDTAWKIKLLPWQNDFIVARVVRPTADPLEPPNIFSFDIYQIPQPGEQKRSPILMGRQFFSGLFVSDFRLSDLELSWFSAASNPVGLLNTPYNQNPPPISIYAVTKNPSGVAHFVLDPKTVKDQWYHPQNGLGKIPKYQYAFPAQKIGRYTWKGDAGRAQVLPGAYRAIMFTFPRYRPKTSTNLNGLPIERFFTYRLVHEDFPPFACVRRTGCTESMSSWNPHVQQDEIVPGGEPNDENIDAFNPIKKPSLIDAQVAAEMKYPGITAMAWDESTGRFIYAVAGETEIRLLDFGKPVDRAIWTKKQREADDMLNIQMMED